MNNNKNSIVTIIIAVVLGAFISWGTLNLIDDDSTQREHIANLENRILDLELSLEQKEATLAYARAWPNHFAAQGVTAERSFSDTPQSTNNNRQATSPTPERDAAVPTLDYQHALKELSTTSERDPRSFSEKVIDLLATNPSHENIAIASQGIVNMAENPESLPDYALQSLYDSQNNTDLKRVVAQVLSMRGDNSLMDKQINGARAGLRSDYPVERQKTLAELAKTHYAGAANLIAPMLKDVDTGVKLDALLALRVTGNQSHIHLLESLTDHPDPAISWLANDVVKKLQNLSDTARMQLTKEDIAAELPIMTMP